MSKKYLIEDMDINKNSLRVSASNQFKKQWLLADFFVEYDDDVDLGKCDYSILQIPFLLNVIPVVWLSGEEYHINSLDEDLAISLQGLRDTFRKMHPGTSWIGEIIPDRLVSNAKLNCNEGMGKNDRIGVLFSGGIDSVCTSFRHINKPQVLITVWGSNVALENKTGWAITRENCRQFGRIYGHSNSFIKSNFNRFLFTSRLKTIFDRPTNWWNYVQHGLGLTGLTAPILKEKRCSKLFVAAAHIGGYQGRSGSQYLAYNKIGWGGLSVILDGLEFSRPEKLRFIKKSCEAQQKPKPKLDVCLSETRTHGNNCCRCEKCLRSITSVLIEGENIEDYGFEVSTMEALTLVREKFTTVSMRTSEGVSQHWKTLQKAARQVLSRSIDSGAIDDDLRSYFQWLSSFDFDEYLIRYEQKLQPPSIIRFIKQLLKSPVIRFSLVGRTLQRGKEQYYYRLACAKNLLFKGSGK